MHPSQIPPANLLGNHDVNPQHFYDYGVASRFYMDTVGQMQWYLDIVRLGVVKFSEAIRAYYHEVILVCTKATRRYLDMFNSYLVNYGTSLMN